MTKNMTQKGLALGAAAALVAAGFSAVPANAAGLADTSFVSLAPTTGTAYTTLAGSTYTFSLTGNEASTVAGGNLKFLVSDPSELIEVALPASSVSSEGNNFRSVSFAENSAVLLTDATGLVDTVRITSAAAAAALDSGDRIYFTADLTADDGNDTVSATIASDDTLFTVTVDKVNDYVTFTSDKELSTLTANDGLLVEATARVAREARDATDKTFVVDTGSNSASTESILVLQSDSAVTRSVDVTSWVDSNGNDEIDSTEYASPVRTVTFKKSTEVSLATTIATPLLGASSLTASVTTTPELNGPQVLAVDANALAVGFTRQGIAGANYDPTATWDATNKEFDFSIAPNSSAVNGLSDQTGTAWTSLSTVIAGTYSATGYLIASTTKSATASTSVAAVVADDIKGAVAATANITPGSSVDSTTPTVITVRKDEKNVVVTAAVFDDEGDAVGAGIPVTATFTDVVGTHKVNGTTAANSGTKTALTNASGVATFEVVSSTAADSNRLVLTLEAQGVTAASSRAAFDLNWSTATYEIFDRNDDGVAFGGTHNIHRSINKGGSYTFDFAVVDQWGQPIADGHRLRIAATGRTVGTSFATVSAGRASYTITDGGITATTDGAVALDVTIEQASGAAELVTVDEFVSGENSAFSVDILDETNVVVLGANGAFGTLNVTVDLDDDMSKSDTLQAIDTRLANVAAPVTGLVLVAGQVDNSLTADPREGAVVTISGDASFLFQDGEKNSYGSITTLADENGEFAVTIASNKAATDSVVTVTANGASKTVKVSFNAAAATEGTNLVIEAPVNALPGSTYAVTATLTDKYGNPVQVSTAGDVAVSYTGPGIVFGTLPNTTNAKGQLTFAVLLGANDKGTASITVSYDRNSDGDFTGTALPDLDIVKSVSVAVGAAAPSSEAKVNAGSFKGFVAVYAKGYAGKRLSAKIGNDWVIVPALASNFVRVTDFTGAGVSISVRIYIDRVLVATIPLVTK